MTSDFKKSDRGAGDDKPLCWQSADRSKRSENFFAISGSETKEGESEQVSATTVSQWLKLMAFEAFSFYVGSRCSEFNPSHAVSGRTGDHRVDMLPSIYSNAA